MLAKPTHRRRHLARPSLLCLLALGIAATAALANEPDPFPARLLDSAGLLTPRFGSMTFVARDGNRLEAVTYRGTRFEPSTGPIWFVLHGAGRTAASYAEAAAPVAERYDALVLAIHFPEELYPKGSDYTLGISRGGALSSEVHVESEWRSPDRYLYAEIEHVFESVRTALGGAQAGYFLFGHSAGAQFVHRLLTFLPRPRVLGAVCANAGWYTLPSRGGGHDPNYFMPYGIEGTPLREADLRRLLREPLTILLGDRDTMLAGEDDLLRDTHEARAQGSNRLERGLNYHTVARSEAKALGVALAWKQHIVPGAGHDKDEMMPSAGFCLFDTTAAPCTPSTAAAAALVVTEIHADPAPGPGGDANADGVRDASADEFVELLNSGSTPICLTGWTLGDAEDPQRHRFPLAGALPPGGCLVVFGGGQPTGDFGNAQVQWAVGGKLNLSNAGDVLTLRDAAGVVVKRISWGDCGGAPCAAEHIEGTLDLEGSLVRWPEPDGDWTPHVSVAPRRQSAGTRADTTLW